MIRLLRVLLLVFFIGTTAVFSYVKVNEYKDSDNEAPVISAEQDSLEVSVADGNEVLLEGMKAEDNKDGDVTDTLVIVSRSKFITDNTVNVNYAAFDSHDNVGTYTRRVTYTDYVSPKFTLSAPFVFRADESYPDYISHIRATDVIDGDISTLVKLETGNKSEDANGNASVAVTFNVTNQSGDTSSITLTASLLNDSSYSKQAPALSTYLLYAADGIADYSTYVTGVLRGQTATSFANTDYTLENIQIDASQVQWTQSGVYPIVYTLYEHLSEAQIAAGQTASALGSTTLFVVVR